MNKIPRAATVLKWVGIKEKKVKLTDGKSFVTGSIVEDVPGIPWDYKIRVDNIKIFAGTSKTNKCHVKTGTKATLWMILAKTYGLRTLIW